jgi:DNA polymerase elongation subunit (family B)
MLKTKITSAPKRVLDFDVETVAAGFADPNWVPQKITCVAWSWIGEDKVHSRICTTEGLYGKPFLRKKMLEPLLEAIDRADMLTGHNIVRFDLPVINSECLRLGLPSLKGQLVQDTMALVKTKGFKKGQDNLIELTGVPIPKQALTWQGWEDAYEEPGWKTVVERCESDVMGHKVLREKMLERGWLRPPRRWNP